MEQIWIGSMDGGLAAFDPRSELFIHYHQDPNDPASLSNEQITSLYVADSGTVWVGTWGGGLDHFDPRTNAFTHFRHDDADPGSLGRRPRASDS